VKDAAPVAAAPAVSGADAVPNKDTMRGGTVTGKVDRKFTKGNSKTCQHTCTFPDIALLDLTFLLLV
jgi:hypothetical protein